MSITWYQKSSFSQNQELLSPFFPLWQDFNRAANELFNISHSVVYTITHALLCEACLCHTAGEQLYLVQSSLHGSDRRIVCSQEKTQLVSLWLKCGQWSVNQQQSHSLWLPSSLINRMFQPPCAVKQRHLCKFHIFVTSSLIDHPQSRLWQFWLQTHHQFLLYVIKTRCTSSRDDVKAGENRTWFHLHSSYPALGTAFLHMTTCLI